MSEERRDILLAAECSDGFPAWWSAFYDRSGGWRGFQKACEQALTLYHSHGVDPQYTVLSIECERAAHGF